MTTTLRTRKYEILVFPSTAEMEASWKSRGSDKPHKVSFRLRTEARMCIEAEGVIVRYDLSPDDEHIGLTFRADPGNFAIRGTLLGDIDLSGVNTNEMHQPVA